MKRTIRLALPLVGAALLASCGASPSERMAEGNRAFVENRYQEARVAYSSVLQDEPANIGAMDKLIRTYLAMEDPVAVEGLLDRMAALGYLPEDAPVLYGEAELMLGRFNSALERASQSGSADAWRVRAIAHVGLGQPERADAAFAKGLSAPGPKAQLLAAYARYKLGEGDVKHARALATESIEHEPVAQLGLLTLAEIEQFAGRHKSALEWYERTLRTFPESRAALIGRITMLGELGEFKKVRPIIKDLRKRFPQDRGYIYLDAMLAAEEQDWAKVRELLQPIERELETMPAANILYARALLGLGHREQARVRLSSQLLREPGNREARYLLATAKLAVGDAEGAVEVLRPVVQGEDARPDEIALMAKATEAAGGA